MRRLKITHLTEYRYAVPVTLEPHRLLLRPREGPDVHIESSALAITPTHTIKWHRDPLDNAAAVVVFTAPAETLAVRSEVVIQHYEETPLDFIVAGSAVNYPFAYDAGEWLDLQPFLQPVYPHDEDAVRGWLDRIELGRPAMQTYVLLARLCRAIADGFTYTVREEPGVQSPGVTLRCGRGSCRDFAALYIETCRQLGLASRFVSGYAYDPVREGLSATTHAWAEVYLPGAGWKGFDPTGGELAGSRHIAVAVARHPETVPPVSGSYLGSDVPPPTLHVDVSVVAL